MHSPQTFTYSAALLTPPGRGAVATVRFCGDIRLLDANGPPLFRATNGLTLAEQSLRVLRFGHWGHEAREEAVVCRHDSAIADIHCHGGATAARRILSDLRARGCPSVSWAEQVLAKRGAFAAECCEALSQAATLRTAEILLHQQSGVLRAALESLASTPARGHAGEKEFLTRIDDLLSWSKFGLHLTRSWQVVLTGRPNVGKSSLINALLGYARSIVYDEPGTTRDVVTAETALAGWPVQLADTAGYRESPDAIEAAGIALARASLNTADCRVIVLDIGRLPEEDDFELMRAWPDALLVANKCDLPDRWGTVAPREAIRVSSRTNAGVEALADAIALRLVPRSPGADTAIPVSERQIALLREARSALAEGDGQRARELVVDLVR